MSTAAKATGYLELNITGFDQALKTAKNLLATFAAGFTAYKIADFFKDGIKGAIDFGKEMQSASRAMGGFDPGNLLLAQKALEKAGMGAEEARGHIADFISQGRHVSALFGGADNYARALKSAAADYGSQAAVLSRSGEKLQSVWNTMESIGSRVKEYFLSMTEQFVLPLQTSLDYLNEIHLDEIGASFGKAIGEAATTLLGVFKNGDAINALKTGVEWAFFSAGDVLMTGVKKVVEYLKAAMEVIGKAWSKTFSFGSNVIWALKVAFVGLGNILASSILGAAAEASKGLGLQSAGNTIQGKADAYGGLGSTLLGGAKGILENTDFGQGMKDIMGANAAGMKAAESVKLGDTDAGKVAKDLWESMKDMLDKGKTTGTQMNDDSRNKHAGDEKANKSVLNTFSSPGARVIADSLAKVGGGGNYLKVGMSLQERTQMQIARATRETAEATKALAHDAKNKPTQPATLGRGR